MAQSINGSDLSQESSIPLDTTITLMRQKLTAEELQWLESLIKAYGKEWVVRHQGLLEEQLEYIRSL